jgi:hypothetical protein
MPVGATAFFFLQTLAMNACLIAMSLTSHQVRPALRDGWWPAIDIDLQPTEGQRHLDLIMTVPSQSISSPRPWRQRRGIGLSLINIASVNTNAAGSPVGSQFVRQKRSTRSCCVHDRVNVITTESAGVWDNEMPRC